MTTAQTIKSINQVKHPEINFNCYGKVMHSIVSQAVIDDTECVARVELSGSEGCYVEIVKWHDEKQQWRRFAFRKFFSEKDASYWELEINKNSAMAKVFHKFPDWE